MPIQLTAPAVALLKPLRLNFAQYCLWCEDRWCESPRCIELHDQSEWMICPDCNGTCYLIGQEQERCICAWGLIESTSQPVADPFALDPVEEPEPVRFVASVSYDMPDPVTASGERRLSMQHIDPDLWGVPDGTTYIVTGPSGEIL